MYIDFLNIGYLEVWQIVILSVFAISFLIQFIWWLTYFTGVLRYNRKIRKNIVKYNTTTPPVSVIICARDEEVNLAKNMPAIMSQEYPDYEVIVVNDSSIDDTEGVIAQLKIKYPNLRSTYVPETAKFIDSKKFALTLGIKSAANDILIFTDADCIPESNKWLSNIVRNFDDNTDIVLGYGAYEHKKTLLNCLQVFDTLFIGIQYFNYSLAGKTYMGVGRNLAYRKSLFLNSKGFSKHLDIQSGDDDLFINEVATPANTKVEFQKESKTISEPKANFHQWFRQKERHLSTGAYYKPSIKMLLGSEIAFRTLFYLSLIASLIVGNIDTAYIVAACFAARYALQYFIINKTASILGERHYYIGILLLDMLLPLINLSIHTISKAREGNVYKWK